MRFLPSLSFGSDQRTTIWTDIKGTQIVQPVMQPTTIINFPKEINMSGQVSSDMGIQDLSFMKSMITPTTPKSSTIIFIVIGILAVVGTALYFVLRR